MIAQEGWSLVGGVAGVALLLSWYGSWGVAAPFWALAAACAYLFRDPHRRVLAHPLGVISPVDAVVNAVGVAHDPCLDREALRIRLCMDLTSVYSVRAPIEGRIAQRWQEKLIGNRCADGDDNDEYDDYGIWIQSDEKDDVILLMPGGLPFRHPRFYAHAGERVGQGQRCGFIRFGSRVDLLVPRSARLGVEVGQRVRAGESVLASLVHVKSADNPSVPS